MLRHRINSSEFVFGADSDLCSLRCVSGEVDLLFLRSKVGAHEVHGLSLYDQFLSLPLADESVGEAISYVGNSRNRAGKLLRGDFWFPSTTRNHALRTLNFRARISLQGLERFQTNHLSRNQTDIIRLDTAIRPSPQRSPSQDVSDSLLFEEFCRAYFHASSL